MLIKVLINSLMTTAAASVPVAAGAYVYLCAEDAKALSHESLSLKLLQKKPKAASKPVKPAGGTGGQVGNAAPVHAPVQGGGGSQEAKTPRGGSSIPSSSKVGSSSKTPPNNSVGPGAPSVSYPRSTTTSTTTTTSTAPIIPQPVTPPVVPPIPAAPVVPSVVPKPADPAPPKVTQSPATKPGTNNDAMTLNILKAFITQESTKNAGQKDNWDALLKVLPTLDESEKNTLLSRFSFN